MQKNKISVPSKSEVSRIASILGSLGGSKTSEKKAKSSALNGAKGGRPKKKNNLK